VTDPVQESTVQESTVQEPSRRTGPDDRRDNDRRTSARELLVEITELRTAVGTLAHRTEALSSNFQQVNDLTVRQQNIDQQSSQAIRDAAKAMGDIKALDAIVITRDEHERRWKVEQEALIRLRLRINRHGLIQSLIALSVSLAALVIAGFIVVGQNNANTEQARNACLDRVRISKQALPSYAQLLNSPTIDHDAILKSFIELAQQSALKNSQVDCG
jgi:hypothetical protein